MAEDPIDVIVIGAGAAGMMCAIEAGKRGRQVLLLDHASAAGEKIRISGGGRCNFTNIHTSPNNFISNNPHFCKSALARYTPRDFIQLVESHDIAYYEKTLGQLFCRDSSNQIVAMLLKECEKSDVKIALNTSIHDIQKADGSFYLATSQGPIVCRSVVIATGGKSIPKMGATGFGYELATKFGLNVIPPRPGLVPLTFDKNTNDLFATLSGVSLEVIATSETGKFREALLFTHRGISGPVILQISSYWREGEPVMINLCPDHDILKTLQAAREKGVKQSIATFLTNYLPKRLAQNISDENQFWNNRPLAEIANKYLEPLAQHLNAWRIKPQGTEGYRKAEVTIGGVDTNELSSKTFESKKVPGLYFIGEVVDVTGHLGGYNLQWAWASGFAAGADA